MKHPHKQLRWLPIIALSLLIAWGCSRAGVTPTSDLKLQVVRVQNDGGKHYQKIRIGDEQFSFFERGRELRCRSNSLAFRVFKDKDGSLSSFNVLVRQDHPVTYKSPPHPSQSLGKPLTSRTAYHDLDGDTVLDTMVKIGPDLHEAYILHHNTWLHVRNSKVKWEYRKSVMDVKGERKYAFQDGKWAAIN